MLYPLAQLTSGHCRPTHYRVPKILMGADPRKMLGLSAVFVPLSPLFNLPFFKSPCIGGMLSLPGFYVKVIDLPHKPSCQELQVDDQWFHELPIAPINVGITMCWIERRTFSVPTPIKLLLPLISTSRMRRVKAS